MKCEISQHAIMCYALFSGRFQELLPRMWWLAKAPVTSRAKQRICSSATHSGPRVAHCLAGVWFSARTEKGENGFFSKSSSPKSFSEFPLNAGKVFSMVQWGWHQRKGLSARSLDLWESLL